VAEYGEEKWMMVKGRPPDVFSSADGGRMGQRGG